jgi:hypothetical protein
MLVQINRLDNTYMPESKLWHKKKLENMQCTLGCSPLGCLFSSTTGDRMAWYMPLIRLQMTGEEVPHRAPQPLVKFRHIGAI